MVILDTAKGELKRISWFAGRVKDLRSTVTLYLVVIAIPAGSDSDCGTMINAADAVIDPTFEVTL